MGSLKGNISKFFAWIMVSIVIVSLAGFGIQDVILGSSGRNIATVGKEKITVNNFLVNVESEILKFSQEILSLKDQLIHSFKSLKPFKPWIVKRYESIKESYEMPLRKKKVAEQVLVWYKLLWCLTNWKPVSKTWEMILPSLHWHGTPYRSSRC